MNTIGILFANIVNVFFVSFKGVRGDVLTCKETPPLVLIMVLAEKVNWEDEKTGLKIAYNISPFVVKISHQKCSACRRNLKFSKC